MHTLTPDQIPEKWGDIAAAYEKAFEKLTFQFAEDVLSRLELKPEERLLDVAAGTGAFSLAAAEQGATVLATDFADGMVERIRQRIDEASASNIDASKIETRVMNGEALDIEDACFDVSVSIVGLIFFPDIDKGFSELKRVLKPGGRCAVVCWDFPESFDMMKLLKQSIANAVPDFEMPAQTPVWARLVGEQALEEKFQQAGFSRVDVKTIDGLLKIDSVEDFWSLFIASSPPMISLFSALGEENTKRAGEEFAKLA
ncbi:MAG: methyltransferase domain-containing protein, partial [Proteobacteria bacterium]|nr:methyltransferase domain-containing protein [Pseudomonadota bacterium]